MSALKNRFLSYRKQGSHGWQYDWDDTHPYIIISWDSQQWVYCLEGFQSNDNVVAVLDAFAHSEEGDDWEAWSDEADATYELGGWGDDTPVLI